MGPSKRALFHHVTFEESESDATVFIVAAALSSAPSASTPWKTSLWNVLGICIVSRGCCNRFHDIKTINKASIN